MDNLLSYCGLVDVRISASGEDLPVISMLGFFGKPTYSIIIYLHFRWVECVVSDPMFFSLCTEYCPVHLALIDEVVTCHPLLHQRVLELFIQLFEAHYENLEILAQLEIKKMLLDRLVNLLSKGFVIPVVKYILACWQGSDTDISLIRYFVKETLDTIAPPYSLEFVQLFLPLVENDEITESMRNEDEDPVSEFIVHCRANFDL